jgi:hypothetical protein
MKGRLTMNLSEKAAYLDGLSDGLGLKKDGKMGSFWTALNGLLGDMAHQIEELKTSHTKEIHADVLALRQQLAEKQKRNDHIDNLLRKIETVLGNLEKKED